MSKRLGFLQMQMVGSSATVSARFDSSPRSRHVPSCPHTGLEPHLKKLSAALTKRLKLADAVIAEAATIRNLLPAEPSWDSVHTRAVESAGYLDNQLRAGFHPSPQVEIAARKPAHGVRPVPYWGILERVAYRALTTAALAKADPLDRSPQAYLKFVTAPGRFAQDRQPPHTQENELSLFFWGESPVNYVVKSDLAAFYQFIDHAVLAEELLLLGVDYELIEALMELLAEVQGRNYGLPQLFDASDLLSELYADKIERDLLRSGFAVWRFNDDFRLACDTYADALAAIEALDAAARRVGLVLSESKTFTVGLTNYIIDVFDLSPSDTGQAVNLDNVEDMVGDYTDDFGEEDADEALAVIGRAQVRLNEAGTELSEEQWIRLRNLHTDDVRLLRRAINGLTIAADPRAVKDVVRLAIYAPSLTPNLMGYLTSVGNELEPGDGVWDDLASTIDFLANDVALNAWQNLWLVDVIRELALLNDGSGNSETVARRVQWVDGLRRDTTNEALRAVATRALAAQGLLPIETVIADSDRNSDALLHIYTSAGRACVDHLTDRAAVDAQKVIDAWASTSRLHECLLKEA